MPDESIYSRASKLMTPRAVWAPTRPVAETSGEALSQPALQMDLGFATRV
jgi:hypothetical protein